MNVYEIRRLRLKQLIQSVTMGNVAVFAGRFGYKPAQMSQYLSNTYNDGRSIGERAARALEQRASLPPGFLDRPLNFTNVEKQASLVDAEASLESTSPSRWTASIPVLSIATTDESGLVELRKVDEMESIPYVAYATEAVDAYAIRIKGSRLAPRYRSGEIIVIDPSLTPNSGDDVLMYLASDEHMVCHLLYKRADEWTFGSVNDEGQTATVDDSDIGEIGVIVGAVRPR